MIRLNRFRLSRRTLLRGLGATIALPTLEAMLDGNGRLYGAAHAQGAPALPQRLVAFFVPNGVPVFNGGDTSRWTPSASGAGYSLTPSLQPLSPWRADFNILTGLRLGNEGTAGNGHERGCSCFTTGTAISSSKLGPTGPSMEWQAGSYLAQGAVPYRALAVAADQPLTSSPSTVFPSPNVYANISWVSKDTPAVAYRDPQALFDAIFRYAGNQPAAPNTEQLAAARRASVLDAVAQDAKRLQGSLGVNDRRRVDQHLAAVRQLEQELSALPAPRAACALPSRPSSQPNYSTQKADLQAQLLAMALRCDVVRYASFMIGNGNDNANASGSAAGVMGGQHETTHNHSSPGSIDKLQQWTTYQVGRFATLLRALKNPDDLAATAEGAGQALDNCLLYLGSEMFDGNTHDTQELPVVLAGRGGGKHLTGRHIVYPQGQYTVSHMLLAMFKMAGVPQSSFGGVSTALPNLS